MTLLVAGLVVFLGMHSARFVAPGLKSSLTASIGALGWRGVYSVVSLAGLLMIIYGYGDMRMDPDVVLVWDPPLGMRHAASLLTLIAFIFLAGAFVPGNVFKAKFGHPMLLSVKTWALAHLLANGRLGDIVLFGAFLAWAVIDYIVCRRSDRAAGVTRGPASAAATAITVVVGAAVWAVFAMYLHLMLIGVSPFAA